jgi:hypothetical protein
MKAKFIFENTYSGEYSWTEFNMGSDWISLTTKIQISNEDEEEIKKEYIDPMILDKFLLKRLGINYAELEQMNMEEEFTIHSYNQVKDRVLFKTNIEDVIVSITELFNLAEETQKIQKY